jgi:hypothetical protein
MSGRSSLTPRPQSPEANELFTMYNDRVLSAPQQRQQRAEKVA